MIDKRLINAVPQAKKYVFFTVALKWLSLAANTVLIFSVAQIIKTKGKDIIVPAALALVSAAVTFLCSFLVPLTSFKSSCQVKKTLRSMIYEKLLALGAEYQEKAETAKIVQLAVEGVEQLETWFGAYLPQLFYAMAAALTTFAVLSFVCLKMAVILLVCVPLIPFAIVAVQKIAKRILSKYWTQYASLADNFLENLQGLTTLEIYQADEFKQKRMGEEAEHFRKVTMKVLSMQLNSIIVMDIVAFAGAGLGIAAAVASYRSGALSLSNCFACILISADFFIPLRRLGSYFHTAMNGTTASNNIFEFLNSDVRRESLGSNEAGDADPADCHRAPAGLHTAAADCPPELVSGSAEEKKSFPTASDIHRNDIALYELKNVSYSFNGRTVLKNCNLQINKGEFVAFAGASGSGKSTAAKILCGINLSYGGSALLCGHEINTIPRGELYKKVIYISHRDWIFKGSVRDTLLEGKNNASQDDMWRALEQVQLSDFVKDNGGLGFEILENASNLSGGQKQRLSIARALLHNPEVLIFDEATSNIDVESEKAILELLHSLKNKKTVLMISHRAENCAGADRIYEFEDGEVSE